MVHFSRLCRPDGWHIFWYSRRRRGNYITSHPFIHQKHNTSHPFIHQNQCHSFFPCAGTIFEWCNTEPNALPAVTDVVYYFNEDTPGVRKLQGTDPDGDSVKFELTGTTEFGELLFTNPSQGTFEYKPGLHFSGEDTLTVVANDGKENGPPRKIKLVTYGLADAPTIEVWPYCCKLLSHPLHFAFTHWLFAFHLIFFFHNPGSSFSSTIRLV